MRSIGSLGDREQAERFAAYLLSQDIGAKVDAEGENWEIWVVDEDKVEAGKTEFAQFVEAPDDPRYAEAIKKSNRYKQQQLEEALAQRRVEVRRRRLPRQRGFPLTLILIFTSVWVTAATRFGESNIPLTRLLMMSDVKATERRLNELPNLTLDDLEGPEGIPEIRRGEIWRIFTPMFLHFTTFHILFNMIWLYRLGGVIEFMKGTWYYLLLVLLLEAVAGFTQLYTGGPFHGGMSGVGYGLFGYVWMRSKFAPDEGFYIDPATVFLFLAWAVICLTGAAGPIANGAHFGGLAAGALIGAMPALSLRNPR